MEGRKKEKKKPGIRREFDDSRERKLPVGLRKVRRGAQGRLEQGVSPSRASTRAKDTISGFCPP
jgi:hypothetical protein